ncbi:uncharacterized protein LOC141902700 [Tubulanus polymorphus]|uniref:uncharacterized protein LOC141902700 n=1 Tax=Tubulanus polymorphus TaxID=672921 RepID=UPI003DA5E1B7
MHQTPLLNEIRVMLLDDYSERQQQQQQQLRHETKMADDVQSLERRHVNKTDPNRVVTQDRNSAAMENHLSDENLEYKVIVKFDDRYLRTGPGIVKFLLAVTSIIGLGFVTCVGDFPGAYLLLPMDSHMRMYVFVTVSCFMTCIVLLLLQTTGLIKMFQFNWHFVDLAVFSWFTFMYLVAASLIAGAVVSYQRDGIIRQSIIQQLIVATVLGYVCMCMCAASAFNGYRRWRGSSQFRRFRLQELERLERLQNVENV